MDLLSSTADKPTTERVGRCRSSPFLGPPWKPKACGCLLPSKRVHRPLPAASRRWASTSWPLRQGWSSWFPTLVSTRTSWPLKSAVWTPTAGWKSSTWRSLPRRTWTSRGSEGSWSPWARSRATGGRRSSFAWRRRRIGSAPWGPSTALATRSCASAAAILGRSWGGGRGLAETLARTFDATVVEVEGLTLGGRPSSFGWVRSLLGMVPFLIVAGFLAVQIPLERSLTAPGWERQGIQVALLGVELSLIWLWETRAM